MKPMACPNCGGDTRTAAGKPYCTNCGWNITAAESIVRLRANVDLFLALLLVALLAYGAYVRRGNVLLEIAAAVALIGIIPLYYFVRAIPLNRFAKLRGELSLAPAERKPWLKVESHREVRRVSRDAATGTASPKKSFEFHFHVDRPQISIATEPATTVEPATAQKSLAEEELQRLKLLPQPRSVRMTNRGMLYVFLGEPTLVALACLFGSVTWKRVTAAGSIGTLSESDWVSAVGTLVIVGAFVHVLRKIIRHRHLLADGALTLGRVVRQTTGRYETSTITYSFADSSSRIFTRSGTDYSKQYYEGMWTLIFYDPLDPRKNVADGCALYALKGRSNPA